MTDTNLPDFLLFGKIWICYSRSGNVNLVVFFEDTDIIFWQVFFSDSAGRCLFSCPPFGGLQRMINGVSERGQNSVYLAESEAICVQFLFPPTVHTVQCFPFQKIRKKICLLLLFPHCCRVGSSRIRYSTKSTASEPAFQSLNDPHIRKKITQFS